MHGLMQHDDGVLMKAERPLEATQDFTLTFTAPG